MVSVCLPSDSLSQHLPSYWGFSYLGRGVSLHGCSSKVHLLLLILDKGYLLTATLPNLEHGVAPLGPPAPAAARRVLGLSPCYGHSRLLVLAFSRMLQNQLSSALPQLPLSQKKEQIISAQHFPWV